MEPVKDMEHKNVGMWVPETYLLNFFGSTGFIDHFLGELGLAPLLSKYYRATTKWSALDDKYLFGARE
jgi:hypothetical protein